MFHFYPLIFLMSESTPLSIQYTYLQKHIVFCFVLCCTPNVWKFAIVPARCCPLYLPSCHSWRIKMTTVGLLGTTEHTTVPWEYCLMCNTSKRHDNKVKHWTKTIFCVLLHFMTVTQWSILDRKFSTSTMPVLMKVGWRIRHIILPIYLKWIWSWVFRVENTFLFKNLFSFFWFDASLVKNIQKVNGVKGSWLEPFQPIAKDYWLMISSYLVTWPALHQWCRAGHVTPAYLLLVNETR